MEAVLFCMSMLALTITLGIMISIFLNTGLKSVIDLTRKPVKMMTISFASYIFLFASYILVSHSA